MQSKKSNKKIALVYPYFKRDTYLFGWPLGLGYISSYLKKDGYISKIFHAKDYQCSKEDMLKSLKEYNPSYIGVYSNYALRNECVSFLKILRSNGYKTIVGGPDPTLRPELYAKDCDFVIRGEGEHTLTNFLKNEKPVRGMVFFKNNKIKILEKAERIENLDSLPFPEQPIDRQISIMTSRGCPFVCTFCQPVLTLLFGAGVRFRSYKNVVDEIEHYYKLGIKDFYFLDENFTLHYPHLKNVCDEIKKRNLKIKWYGQARVNTLNEEKVMLLKKSGCSELKFGVESGSPRILSEIYNKCITIEDIKKAFKLCKKHGLLATAYIMIGAPTETKDDFEATLTLLKEITPDGIHVSITTLVPNTHLYERFKELFTEKERVHTLSFATDNPQLCLKWVDPSVSFNNILDYKERYLKVVIDKANEKAKDIKIKLLNKLTMIYFRITLGKSYLRKCIDASIDENGLLKLGLQRNPLWYERLAYQILKKLILS